MAKIITHWETSITLVYIPEITIGNVCMGGVRWVGESTSDLWAPLSTFCLLMSQVNRFVVVDNFLQYIEFQIIINFKKQMYVGLVISHNDN